MMQPSTRFAVNTFAALGGGTNVNDLITVSNQSIEEGGILMVLSVLMMVSQ